MTDEAGHSIGDLASRYRIIERIGEGGMGVVYKAEDITLQRLVALKFLHRAHARDPRARARFMTEARAASALEHPNICSVHAVGETDQGDLYIAMGYLEGETLRSALERGPLDHSTAMDVFRQTSKALRSAHDRGIVHRDIKPENIFLLPDGGVKVLDFGLARFSHTRDALEGQTAGTLAYMSPELLRCEDADRKTDIWSLGVVLYEMLTGKQPFTGFFPAALNYSILNETYPDPRAIVPTIPADTAAIIDACLRKNCAERPESVAHLLRSTDENLPASVAPPKRASRRLLLGITAVLVALVGTGYLLRDKFFGIAEQTPDAVCLGVLPFVNLTGDKVHESLCDLIPSMLQDGLTRISGISVRDNMSLGTTMRNALGSTNPDFSDPKTRALLAREGIRYLVTGSFSHQGEDMLIQYRMVDKDGQVRYSSPRKTVNNVDSVTSIIQTITSEIADFLSVNDQIKSDASMQAWMGGGGSRSLAAQKSFLMARQIVYRGEPAGEQLEDALAYDSTFIAARIWYISHLLGYGQRDEALRQHAILQRMRARANPFEQAMILYIGAMIRGDQVEQMRYLQVALEHSPGNFILLLNLAELRIVNKDYQGTLDAVMPSVRARWGYAPVYPLAVLCMIKLNRLSEAQDLLRDTWSTACEFPSSYGLRAYLYRLQGNTDSAAWSEQQCELLCLQRGRTIGSGLELMAEVYLEVRDSAALSAARRAVAENPEYSTYRLLLGRALLQAGREDEARKEFETSLQLKPEAAEAYLELGRMFRRKGKVAEAVAKYKRYLSIDSLSFTSYTARRELRGLPLR